MHTDWQELSNYRIAAVKFNLVDRLFLILEIAKYCPGKNIFFWNPAHDFWQKIVNIDRELEKYDSLPTKYRIVDNVISVCSEIKDSTIFVIEGLGKIDGQLSFHLRNFYFDYKGLNVSELSSSHQIILVDEIIDVPLELYSLIPVLEYKIPNLNQIEEFLSKLLGKIKIDALTQACFGLPFGEIQILIQNQVIEVEEQINLTERIVKYKTGKLAGRGLRIVPEPDVKDVGGLDNLDRDLLKIKKLFSNEAKERGLRPPKGGCLWGLPGTGKSLVAKMVSKKLNATLISCDWNELLDSDLSSSLAKLQYVLDVVDNIGNCVLFFDEFEKAFAGWNSGINDGILAKMAGKLLTWMQDHESPAIMLATINHLDMLPPELIRRFGYIWFFPSEMHNGAMWEVFKIHLSSHFPGFHEQLTDAQWRQLFFSYRGCSPAEMAGAIARTHDELFFTARHLDMDHHDLIEELLAERKRFKPAITNKTTSNALAKILMEADFARPVRGEDRSRFAVKPRGLFESVEDDKITFDEYAEIFHKIVQTEPNGQYSYTI
jgi:SpoVK/Ycf46/Vps4 family AAA+-type ATPase